MRPNALATALTYVVIFVIFETSYGGDLYWLERSSIPAVTFKADSDVPSSVQPMIDEGHYYPGDVAPRMDDVDVVRTLGPSFDIDFDGNLPNNSTGVEAFAVSLKAVHGGQVLGSTNRTGLSGDYNANRVVDAADYVVWRNTLSASVAAFSGADGNGNAKVDIGDYVMWRTNFGKRSRRISILPEPTTWSLIIVGCLASFFCYRYNLTHCPGSC